MPDKQLPLPPDFEGRAFSRREGLEAGLTPGVMRHARFRVPFSGVRTSVPLPAEPELRNRRVARLASEYLPLLRVSAGEMFSHTTALALHQVPIRLRHADVHVTVRSPHGPARRNGVIGHSTIATHSLTLPRTSAYDAETVLPCVSPATALLQSALLLPFRELVVAADHLVCPRDGNLTAPIVPYDELVALAEGSSGRGARRMRAALAVTRVGAESRMESLMHFELAKLGLDILELQAVLLDSAGIFIGRFDSMLRAKRKIVEYDGEQHRTDRRQYLKDLERLDAARGLGYSILRLHMEDFADHMLETTAMRMCRFLDEAPRAVPAHLVPYFAEPLW